MKFLDNMPIVMINFSKESFSFTFNNSYKLNFNFLKSDILYNIYISIYLYIYMENNIKAALCIGSYLDTLGFKDGMWEFNFGNNVNSLQKAILNYE